MSTYLLQASPLTRIFLPEWHSRCLEDPQLLFDKKPFLVRIPRAVGSIELWHNKPTLAASLLEVEKGVPKTRTVEEDEVSPLVRWLTDEQNTETDIYGVVEVPIQENVADAIMAMMLEGNEKNRTELIEETRKQMASGIMSARKRADDRVMRACGKMYNVVKSTVEEMKKGGKGIYSPSYAEALAMEVMKDSIAIRRKPDERASKMMDAAMSQMQNIV